MLNSIYKKNNQTYIFAVRGWLISEGEDVSSAYFHENVTQI